MIGQTALQSMGVLGIDADTANILTNAAVQAGKGAEFIKAMSMVKELISEDKFTSGVPNQGVVSGNQVDYTAKAEEMDQKSSEAAAGGDSALAQDYNQKALRFWELAAKQGKANS